jgi:hypothetical protein
MSAMESRQNLPDLALATDAGWFTHPARADRRLPAIIPASLTAAAAALRCSLGFAVAFALTATLLLWAHV